MARPKGSKDKKPRAARGTKMRSGILGFQGDLGAERISTTLATKLSEFDEGFSLEFFNVINIWANNVLTPRLRSSIRNSTWARSGNLQKVKTTVSGPPGGGASSKIQFRVSATFPDKTTEQAGLTQEFGRKSGGSSRYYLVPLASWVNATGRASIGSPKGGRKWKNTEDIWKDLDQDGVFWGKNYVGTSAGPARMIYLYKKGYFKEKKTGSYRDPVTGKFIKRKRITKSRDTLGRRITRGKLKEIATAMYLAYTHIPGIFGTSNTFHKVARKSKSPLAAQFGLTESASANAPMWFSRGAVSSLSRLASAIDSVRVKSEALNRAMAGSGGESSIKSANELGLESAIVDMRDEIFDQLRFENEEGREPSEFEKKGGFR